MSTAHLQDPHGKEATETAYWLVMAGVDVLTVQELAGRKTIAMTMRYAHLAPEHKRRAVGRLEAKSLLK